MDNSNGLTVATMSSVKNKFSVDNDVVVARMNSIETFDEDEECIVDIGDIPLETVGVVNMAVIANGLKEIGKVSSSRNKNISVCDDGRFCGL